MNGPTVAYSTHESAQETIFFDSDLLENPELCRNAFDLKRLQNGGRITKISHGRGPVYFIQISQSRSWVLRHYYRGGLIGKINTDLFLARSARKSRAVREFLILSQLLEAGVPVPCPVAARVVRRYGVCYSADIITEEVPDASTLEEKLLRGSVSDQNWVSIAQAIAHLHSSGVEHRDLNVRNILFSGSDCSVFLIDFDKSKRRSPGRWRIHSINRLLRSLEKLVSSNGGVAFTGREWQVFLDAYDYFLSLCHK